MSLCGNRPIHLILLFIVFGLLRPVGGLIVLSNYFGCQ
ncbi:putative membrane protein [Synechococcus sp. BIOS-E4-1]|nr:putative membrane protein [Synechococcus sp. BIOS-E4-1]